MNKASRYHHRKVLYNLLLMLAVILVSCGENDKGQAEFRQGETAYAARDYSNASQYYLKAAERGHVEAQICIANCYWNGQGVERNDRQAIKWYFEAAKQGNTEAWYRIGVCYAEGRGVERDWEAAARWFQKAADRGHADAMYKLGQGYRFAHGINKDDKKADEYYQKAAEVWLVAAEQGDAEAQFMLATCYNNGNGVNKSKTEALKWYQKAAEQGIADAQYQMGLHCLGLDANNNSSTKAAEWFQKAAEQGHSEAQFELGKCYEKGLGVIWDYVQAFDWYSKAAEQGIADAQTKVDSLLDTVLLLKAAAKGNAEAMLELGIRFEQGKKIPKDLRESLKWYRKAAESGDAEAQLKLAQNYSNGLGVSKDETEAVKWYRKAAEQDNAEAQFQLGRSYENGIGIKQDYSEAFQWYSKAAEQGHADAQSKADSLRDVVRLLEKAGRGDAEAMFELSICFENGESIAKDLSEALKWNRKAAEQGHVEAQYKLALAYENGNGMTKDLSEAVKWYRKAAEQGHVEAQYKLALAYENGYGITQDLSEAVKWYHKAAELKHPEASRHLQSAEVLLAAQNGNAEAQYNLALAYENGNGMTKDLSEAVKWYRKAAEQGHAGAQKKLKTTELLLNAQNGNAEAQYELAQTYEKGSGVTKDLTEAMAWYHKAAEQGHAEAQYKLAEAYETGSGIGANLSEALKWNRKAAEQGIAEAQYKLALAYENGTGVRADFSEAANWYRKAAEQDNAGAQYKLGVYYEKVKTDLSEAANWYRKAAGQGYAKAQEALDSISPVDISGRPTETTLVLPYGISLKMIRVEAGSFEMSAKDGQNESAEKPHLATLTRDFYIGQTEVTQAQWKAVMGTEPSEVKGNNLPVVQISWNDAMEFCDKLNAMGKAPSGWKFSLPTETQWEYAARGGNKSRSYKYSGSNDINEVAWYYANSGERMLSESAYNTVTRERNNCGPHPVGQKKPNELGLYDMSGNVYELCLDNTYPYGISNTNPSDEQKAEFTRGNDKTGTYRIIRGGYWGNRSEECRSSARACVYYYNSLNYFGFRLALVPLSYDLSNIMPIDNRKPLPSGTVRGTTSSSSTSTSTTTPARQEQVQFADNTIFLPGNVPLELMKVEAGTFEMSASDGRKQYNEVPHWATLTKDYYIGRTELTQAQWKAVMGTNPSYNEGNDLPVENVSWNDAMEFCEKLNSMGKAPSGWKFTLPTETQWEYAARGGKKSKGYKYSGSDNIDEVAWYYENSGDSRLDDSSWDIDKLDSNHCRMHPVGLKKANELGFYDMSGNVYEWCLDDYQEDNGKQKAEFTRGNDRNGSLRVYRGGSWNSGARLCRSRNYGEYHGRGRTLGFRVALVQDSGNGSVSPTTISNRDTRPTETVRRTTSSSSSSTSTTSSARQSQSQSAASSSSSRTKQTSPSEPLEYRWALNYEKSGQKDKAFEYFSQAAERGYAAAQYKLGHCYYYGRGIKSNNTEAQKWYRKAADQGYAEAQYWLGALYAHGHCGLKDDDEEAVKWYRRAAEQGHSTAQFNLGFFYENGWGGLPRDMREAANWYRKAAEQGQPDAQYHLGLCYYYGSGVTKDQAEGVKWIRKAANQGYEKAKEALNIY